VLKMEITYPQKDSQLRERIKVGKREKNFGKETFLLKYVFISI
jgi:hypothetical protein